MQAVIENHLPEIKQLMQLHGVERAYVFGSAAKGTMKEDSDVDFMIRFPQHMNFETYSNNYFKLMYALQQLLATEVELVAEETISNPYLLESINQTKVLVL